MISVYLAGPVTNAQDDGSRWRRAVKQTFWDEAEWLDPVERLDYDPNEHAPEDVVEHDKELLSEADAMLIGLTRVTSVGTWREAEYATEVLDIPVAVWIEPGGSRTEDREFSPWILELGYVGPSFKNALDYLEMEAMTDE